ncbi:NFX1-type zinc finger-containing protein 1-like isoform X2 [Nasonia vitripennis]|uniref:RZ-type domain-containing protein n=1 Tax=Nasonia vitripennis TaxID=7425 RepID=A0A7M7TDM0_NASVI|nr:NFX1-type zinc finger-containing protein 1-like isoform X2 [Nasonia vitripennis]
MSGEQPPWYVSYVCLFQIFLLQFAVCAIVSRLFRRRLRTWLSSFVAWTIRKIILQLVQIHDGGKEMAAVDDTITTNTSKNVYKCPKTTTVAQNQANWRSRNAGQSSGTAQRTKSWRNNKRGEDSTRQTFNTSHRSYEQSSHYKRREPHYGRNDVEKKNPGTERNSTAEHKFTFKYLQDLSQKDSNEVISALASKKTDFEQFLLDVPSELMAITIRVLGNVCRANFEDTVTRILVPTLSSHFLDKLDDYLLRLPYEKEVEKRKNKLYHDDVGRFWTDLTDFFKKLIELLPSKACDGLRPILEKIGTIFEFIDKFQKDCRIDEKVKRVALTLHEILEAEVKRIEEKSKATRKPIVAAELETENPPDDYRELSVIPTLKDMINDKPFIRKCKINEPYSSVDHYLDVQFRLLREDFVCPLRSGLKEYLNPNPQKYRNNDLRIYRRVTLLSPGVQDNTVGVTVSFPPMSHVNWRQSKRLIYGGLVLLSNDHFKTILFFTVAYRDEKELAKGRILMEPCEGTVITRDMYNSTYVMLESKIYFEPYWAVLNAMKHLTENDFPMRKYLIDADNTRRLPEYIRDVDSLFYKYTRLPVAYDKVWPNAKSFNMDETQLNAFRSALTQEFSLIQGPPGTGKTFIALEIVGTLLNNQDYWKNYGPIVVICLTNHALDQFLEGVLKYTKKVVRVGSRSQNEALKPYTLMERRKAMYSYGSTDAGSMMYYVKHDMEYILRNIQKTLLQISYLNLPDAIVPLDLLKENCNNPILQDFESNQDLLSWLIEADINPYSMSLDSGFNLADYNKEEQQVTTDIKTEYQSIDNIPEFEKYHKKSVMDDDLELNEVFEVDRESKPMFPLRKVNIAMTYIQKELIDYKNKQDKNDAPFDPVIQEFHKRLDILTNIKQLVQQELKQHSVINPNRVKSNDIYWESYWYWVKDSYENAMNRLHQLEEEYRQTLLRLKDAKQLVDLHTLKHHKIVGMTTTGAAKIYSSIQALHAPIVLVEEAAEILESHVVCSLARNCQQVILIGDHKQLQPKASVYKLGKNYNLNISLFERMVRIMGDCTQLGYQHRMRPQFAKLITPAIYKKLYNHEVVLDYPDVAGLEKNLFFLNHVQREENHDMDDSWTNRHEAEFLVAFARHLVLQGYSTKDITILCTYTGQLFTLTKEKSRYSSILQDLRVTTVDNFQGEENKIILLSLVRNNGEGNIGFLKEETRVCVALSRAREGLYIMGNMDDLVVKNNIWPQIKSVLEDENAIGDVLRLRCQIHSEQLVEVKNAKDFQESPEGGCSKLCGVDMPCGHPCLSVCHMRDREHKEFSCRQPCLKACSFNHPCPLLCYEGCKACKVKVECELRCGHTVEMSCSSDPDTFPCYIQVETTLPDCKHQIQKFCHFADELCSCTYPCDSRLPCGHTCKHTCHVNKDPDHIEYKCSKDCAKTYVGCDNGHPCKKKCFEECGLCPIKVEKTRSCGHFYKQAQCGEDLEKQPCVRPCKRDIPTCGHKCKQLCCDPCGKCEIIVEKKSIKCGHTLKIKCCNEAEPSKCNGKCPKTLPCGHPCTKKCKDQCTTKCQIMVKLNEPGLCGHAFEVPCFLQSNPKSEDLLKYCKESCKTKLACQHYCKGNCGECQQGRMHIFCAEPCGFPLVCGHLCEDPCREQCKSCKRNCELQCQHSKCKNKCGMPCSPCIEKCALGCEHKKCKKRCSEICNIEPCMELCKKKLKCDHPCVGFCGEPCPPLCRICNKDELTELLFGDEDDPDARFVFLEDCKHCIESSGLSKWLELDNDTIKVKTCPKCKTPIKKCARLMNQIKKDLNDVQLVKKKVFYGQYEDLGKIQRKRLETVKNMLKHATVSVHPAIQKFLYNLRDRLTFVRNRRRQILSAQDVDTCRVIVDIINHMIEILSTIEETLHQMSLEKWKKNFISGYSPVPTFRDYKITYKFIEIQILIILESISSCTWHLPKQRLEDIELELLRLHYMAALCIADLKFRKYILASFLVEYTKKYDVVLKKLSCIKRFEKKVQSEVLDALNNLQNEEKTAVIEKCMIVQAMGFKQGHWYKCPNGHPYVIGECGGAMEVANCNECGAKIGGTDHRLLGSNQLASEMDGTAINPAWSW